MNKESSALRFYQVIWALLGLVSSIKITKLFLTEKTEIVKLLSVK